MISSQSSRCDRESAVARIWKAIARLTANAAESARQDAPAKKASAKTKRRAPSPKGARPGTIFEREYKGKTYTLTAIERDGRPMFQLKGGKVFNSLTAAAKAVTGYPSISGLVFWGEGAKKAGTGE